MGGTRGPSRRPRYALAVVAASLVALGAVLLPAPRRWIGAVAGGQPATARVVAWRDSPVPQPASLARRARRADAPACGPVDLGGLAWTEEPQVRMDGSRVHTLLLSNAHDARCTLRGSAGLLGTDTGTGRRGSVSAGRPAPPVGGTGQYPATIDPGEPARIDVTVGPCPGPGTTPVRYRDVALEVAGRQIPVASFELATTCPVGIGTWYVLPPPLYVPYQVATIAAPATARRGEVIDYEVAIVNSSGRPYPLRPCPVLIQRLAGATSSHRLNCAVPAIGPHGTIRFRMRLTVPADAPTGPARLTWIAVAGDGRAIVADLAAGGAPVTITS